MRLMNNEISLRGNLADAPKFAYDQEGNARVARFTIFVFRPNKRDGDKDDTFDVVLFGNDAKKWDEGIKSGDDARIPRKGEEVSVKGSIHRGKDFTDRNGNLRQGTYSVWAQEVFITRYRRDNVQTAPNNVTPMPAPNPTPTPAPAPSQAVQTGFMDIPEGLEDELPFI